MQGHAIAKTTACPRHGQPTLPRHYYRQPSRARHSRLVGRAAAQGGELLASLCSAASSLHLFDAGAACAATSPAAQLDIAADSIDSSALAYPVLLSLLAGLSTSIGGLIAVTLPPGEAVLAFLLGTAIGVMATVSCVELWWHSAAELADPLGVTLAVLGGAALFAALDMLLPKPPEDLPEALLGGEEYQTLTTADAGAVSSSMDHQTALQQPSAATAGPQPSTQQHQAANGTVVVGPVRNNCWACKPRAALRTELQAAGVQARTEPQQHAAGGVGFAQRQEGQQQHHGQHQHTAGPHGTETAAVQGAVVLQGARPVRQRQATAQTDALVDIEPHVDHKALSKPSNADLPGRHQRKSLLRLSLLLGITMTLHNFPEGVAVGFSAFTDIAPVMVAAIGLHNVPEGLILAAPLYAATGSKWKAVGVATASGLSEPLGALLALLVLKPFVKSHAALDYVLAATGGVMLAVCVLELWPEGRRCGRVDRLVAGVVLGAVVMGWTLCGGA